MLLTIFITIQIHIIPPTIVKFDYDVTIFKVAIHFQKGNVIIHWFPEVKFWMTDDIFYR